MLSKKTVLPFFFLCSFLCSLCIVPTVVVAAPQGKNQEAVKERKKAPANAGKATRRATRKNERNKTEALPQSGTGAFLLKTGTEEKPSLYPPINQDPKGLGPGPRW